MLLSVMHNLAFRLVPLVSWLHQMQFRYATVFIRSGFTVLKTSGSGGRWIAADYLGNLRLFVWTLVFAFAVHFRLAARERLGCVLVWWGSYATCICRRIELTVIRVATVSPECR